MHVFRDRLERGNYPLAQDPSLELRNARLEIWCAFDTLARLQQRGEKLHLRIGGSTAA
ncbi:hypothetical protein D3C83_283380 [compost metagenome]